MKRSKPKFKTSRRKFWVQNFPLNYHLDEIRAIRYYHLDLCYLEVNFESFEEDP